MPARAQDWRVVTGDREPGALLEPEDEEVAVESADPWLGDESVVAEVEPALADDDGAVAAVTAARCADDEAVVPIEPS
jgi:hypothetical protein